MEIINLHPFWIFLPQELDLCFLESDLLAPINKVWMLVLMKEWEKERKGGEDEETTTQRDYRILG